MVKKKLCPLKRYKADYSFECLEEECAWWVESVELCGAIVEGHMKAREIMLKEMREDE